MARSRTTVKAFLDSLYQLHSADAFNPYSEYCPLADLKQAAAIRRRLLRQMLLRARRTESVDLWLGRDLGYRAGRRTGLPFTDDAHLAAHLGRWQIPHTRAVKKGEPIRERSATAIWEVLGQISSAVFIWNVFPLHPHQHGNPMSNRAHTAAERRQGEELLQMLLDIIRPRRIMAIGIVADACARNMQSKAQVVKIRHPSYGGQPLFRQQMRQLYRQDRLNQ